MRRLFQRAGLLEQMGGAGDDDQFLFAVQQGISFAIQFDHHIVMAADYQQCRRCNLA